VNEWGFAGEIKSWWDAVISSDPAMGLGRVTIEESPEGEAVRSDITLYDADNHQLLVLELRLPDHSEADPLSIANINNAMNKANSVGARWSATSDGFQFRLLDHSRQDRPTRERAVPVRPLDAAATRTDLDVPAKLAAIHTAWQELLQRLAPVLVGSEAAPQVAADEFFVESLRASLARPFAEIRDSISERRAVDSTFSDELIRWMVGQQGWPHDAKAFEDEIARIAQVATYVFATRLLFYGALRRAQTELPPLDLPSTGEPIGAQATINGLFEHARKATGDYATVFVFDEVSRWALISKGAILGWRRVLELLDNFQLESISFDVLGKLFERLIDPNERYQWGQHYTSPDVVDLMLSAALPDAKGLVLDPASGGGTFLVRAYARKRAFIPSATHNDRLKEIAGADISAFAASVSTVSLATQDLSGGSNYPQVHAGSFFKIRPGEPFVSLPDEGEILTDRILPGAVAVVCNPPYIGSSNIGDARKAEADLAYRAGWPMSPALKNRYNYHLYFWFHAARFLAPTGRMAFITSGEWYDSDYGAQLQDWLTTYFHVELVVESMAEQWFGEARVGTVVLIARRLGSQEDIGESTTRFVTLRRPLADLYAADTSDDTLRLLAVDDFRDRLLALTGSAEGNDFDYAVIRQQDLRALGVNGKGAYEGATWRSHFLRSPQYARELEKRQDFIELSVLAAVKLGAKTGNDAFFYLTLTGNGVSGKPEVRGIGGWTGPISKSSLRPVLQNPRDLDTDTGRRFVVRARELENRYFSPPSGTRDEGVRDYVAAGEQRGVHRQTLVLQNAEDAWFRQGRAIITSPWALPYNSAYDYFAVDNSAARAVLNGRFIGVEPLDGIDSELLGAVLNSTFVMAGRLLVGVATGNEGAYDVGPPAARKIRVPDPRKFSSSGAVVVGAALNAIRVANVIPPAPSSESGVHPLRRQLDQAILEALGENAGDAAVILDYLYASYARWRDAVSNVEGQVRINRRALGARGGSRSEDPAVKAARTVLDEIRDGAALDLSHIDASASLDWLDALAPDEDEQDALIEKTTLVLRGSGSVVDVERSERVDVVRTLRSLGWAGPVPIPDAEKSDSLARAIRRATTGVRTAAIKRLANYLEGPEAERALHLVERLWAAEQVRAIRSVWLEDERLVIEPSLQNADGLVPPSPAPTPLYEGS
jgi:hypothetical protein